MKKFFLSFLLLMSTISMFAYDFEVDGIYYSITSEDKLECKVTPKSTFPVSSDYSGVVNINSKVTYQSKEYIVTGISQGAFYDCSSLTSVNIPNSVTTIGSDAFNGCKSLTSINIPNSVTFIGSQAFKGCPSLTAVTLGNSVANIGESAFDGCYNIQRINLLSAEPPLCSGVNTFVCDSKKVRDKYDVYTYATLHVPMGSKEAYSSAHEWRYFPKIKEDMEMDGQVFYASLRIKQGTAGYTEYAMKADETYTIYIGSNGDNKVKSVRFNGEDVTGEIVDGYYTTPSITRNSELVIDYNEVLSSGDIDGDGELTITDITELISRYLQK